MSLSSWLSLAHSRSRARRGQRRNPAARSKKARFFLEQLDARALPSSYTAGTVTALIVDINAANKAGGANTITLTAPTSSPYVLTANVNDNVGGGIGLPEITGNDNLTILGNGDTIERSTASGTPDFRLVFVGYGTSLTLENLTLQNGLVLYENALVTAFAGGILNEGTLVLSAVSVVDNTVQGAPGLAGKAEDGGSASGGGIWSHGSLTLENNTLLEGNTALGNTGGYVEGGIPEQETGYPGGNAYGGALYVAGGTANINATTFTGNWDDGGAGAAGAADGRGWGGAVYVAAGQVALTASTLSSNAAEWPGGGAYGAGYGGGLCVAAGSVTLQNDTVESNWAPLGGGLYVAAGSVTLQNDTVESNSAGGYGGGLYIVSTETTVYLDSFTVANTINNTDSSGLNGPTANIDGTYILKNP